MSLKITRNIMPSFKEDLKFKGGIAYEIILKKGTEGDMHIKFERTPELEIISSSIVKQRLQRILEQDSAMQKKAKKLTFAERATLTAAVDIIRKIELSNEYMLRLYGKKQISGLSDSENQLLALYEDDFIEQYPELKAKDDTAKGDS